MENEKKIPECPVEMTLQLIGDKWKVLIIRDLLSGTKRFNELMRSVTGITQKVLTSHLRSMEAAGLLTRKVYPEVPPRVEYTLTETGLSLKPILDSMVDWERNIKIRLPPAFLFKTKHKRAAFHLPVPFLIPNYRTFRSGAQERTGKWHAYRQVP